MLGRSDLVLNLPPACDVLVNRPDSSGVFDVFQKQKSSPKTILMNLFTFQVIFCLSTYFTFYLQ